MTASFSYNFEWDPNKAASNAAKHGVTFEHAATVFQDPLALTIPDPEHSEHEDRWITMGLDERSRLLVIIHTYRQENDEGTIIRIILARLATANERKYYEETGQ